MNTTTKTKQEDNPVESTHSKGHQKEYKVDFKPELNGTYTIEFSDAAAKSAGYAILLKGGLFHRFPEGYVINKTHKKLLEDAEIPFKIVKS